MKKTLFVAAALSLAAPFAASAAQDRTYESSAGINAGLLLVDSYNEQFAASGQAGSIHTCPEATVHYGNGMCSATVSRGFHSEKRYVGDATANAAFFCVGGQWRVRHRPTATCPSDGPINPVVEAESRRDATAVNLDNARRAAERVREKMDVDPAAVAQETVDTAVYVVADTVETVREIFECAGTCGPSPHDVIETLEEVVDSARDTADILVAEAVAVIDEAATEVHRVITEELQCNPAEGQICGVQVPDPAAEADRHYQAIADRYEEYGSEAVYCLTSGQLCSWSDPTVRFAESIIEYSLNEAEDTLNP